MEFSRRRPPQCAKDPFVICLLRFGRENRKTEVAGLARVWTLLQRDGTTLCLWDDEVQRAVKLVEVSRSLSRRGFVGLPGVVSFQKVPSRSQREPVTVSGVPSSRSRCSKRMVQNTVVVERDNRVPLPQYALDKLRVVIAPSWRLARGTTFCSFGKRVLQYDGERLLQSIAFGGKVVLLEVPTLSGGAQHPQCVFERGEHSLHSYVKVLAEHFYDIAHDLLDQRSVLGVLDSLKVGKEVRVKRRETRILRWI